MRSIMYAARPEILRLTGNPKLDSRYFTQTLLPDYIEANPAECKTWDVLYDARGSLIEPHTNRQIPLGTQDVRSYLNSTPEKRTGVGGIPKSRRFATIGPENR